MENFISYLIKSSVWLSAFGLVYFLFLRHERFFRLNRLFLLAGLLSAIIFPLITINYSVTIPQIQESVSVGEFSATAVDTIQTPLITWEVIAAGVLLSGTLLFLVRMLIQTLKVIKAIRSSEVKIQNNLKVVKPNHLPHSFSFFSYIFVNPTSPEREIREIVAHEAAHVRQFHWIDLVLAELLCAFQWFNPMAWLYSHFIRQNHEYLADQSALRSSPDPAFYKATLINHLLGSEVIRLGHSFSYSLNKKRFIMMKNTSIPVVRKIKLLFILPFAVLIFFSFSEPKYTYESNSGTGQEKASKIQESQNSKIIEDLVREIEEPLQKTANPALSFAENTPEVIEKSAPRDKLIKLKRQEKNIQVQQSKGKTIIGKVVQENGEPLPGTSVIIVNTTTGTITDKNGEFKIGDIADNAEVAFSFVGFKTAKIQPDFEKDMVVRLKRDTVQKDLNVSFRSNNKTNPEAQPILYLDGKKVPFEALNEISPETIESIDVLKNKSATEKYGEEGKNGVILITSKQENAEKAEENSQNKLKREASKNKTYNGKPVFFIVEEMPKFPGGDIALHNYISNNVKYPAEAKEKGIEGRVYVSYIISPKGKVDDVKVIRGVDPNLDAEAKRVIEGMPDWTPGKQRGKSVAVNFTSPVNFEL
jgi:TonB family protein